MARRSSTSSNSPVALEAKAVVLAVLAALTFLAYIAVPLPWLALGALLLTVGAVGYRIESAIRGLRDH